MVRNSLSNKFKSTGTCATNQYIKQINADGSVVCGNIPYHWGVTCAVGQYIERIASNGTPTCKTVPNPINNITCGTGEFLYRHQNGTLSCRSVSVPNPVENLNCPSGEFLYRHHNGTLYCRADKNVYGKKCSGKQLLRGFTNAGDPICECDWNGSMSGSCSRDVGAWGNGERGGVSGYYKIDSSTCAKSVRVRATYNGADSDYVNGSSVSITGDRGFVYTTKLSNSSLIVTSSSGNTVCTINF